MGGVINRSPWNSGGKDTVNLFKLPNNFAKICNVDFVALCREK
jgi:hypothetical protein